LDEVDWPVFSILNMAARPPGAEEKLPPVPVAIFTFGIRSPIGDAGRSVITSSSSSDELTTLRNLLAPLGGLLALGERASGGCDDDATGFLMSFGFCCWMFPFKEFSINDAVDSSRSSPDRYFVVRPLHDCDRCKWHRNDPECVVGAHRQDILTNYSSKTNVTEPFRTGLDLHRHSTPDASSNEYISSER
jgi:hypothetical protein